MSGWFFFLGILFLFSLCCAVIMDMEMNYTIPFSFSFLGLVVYILFSVRGGAFAYWGVIAVVIGMAGYAVGSQKYRNAGGYLCSYGVAAWVLFAVALTVLYQNYPFVGGDDFSMWTAAAKHLFYRNTMTCAPDSNVSFKWYIPGQACVEYLFLKPLKVWNDDFVHRGYVLWLLSMGLPIFSKIKSKISFRNIAFWIAGIALCVALPFVYNNGTYSSATNTSILIMVAAYTLIGLFTLDRTGRFFLPWLCIMCASLSSLKAAGSSFAVFMVMMWIADEMSLGKKFNKLAGKSVFPILAAMIVNLLWKMQYEIYGYQPLSPYTSTFTLRNLFNLFTGKAPEIQYQIIFKFFRAFFGGEQLQYYGRFPIPNWQVYLCMICLLVFISDFRGSRKRCLVFGAGMLATTAIYQTGILYVYLFSFSEALSIVLASYPRYSALWYGSVVVFLIVLCFHELSVTSFLAVKSNKKSLGIAWVCISGAFLLDLAYVFHRGIDWAPWVYTRDWARDIYADYVELENCQDFMDEERDKVWIIDKSGSGYLYAKYVLTPILCNDDYFLNGSERMTYLAGADHSGDGFFTEDEWRERLKEYSYLYIVEAPDGFERYRDCFGGTIENWTLYKLNRGESLIFSKVLGY